MKTTSQIRHYGYNVSDQTTDNMRTTWRSTVFVTGPQHLDNHLHPSAQHLTIVCLSFHSMLYCIFYICRLSSKIVVGISTRCSVQIPSHPVRTRCYIRLGWCHYSITGYIWGTLVGWTLFCRKQSNLTFFNFSFSAAPM